jgi:hypothetical protein
VISSQTDISDELLLERMNTACAYETERQNKKKLLGQPRPATIHAVQSSDTPVEKSDKSPGQQNSNVKLPPTVALQLKEMRSEMAVLRDLKAEMCQIKVYAAAPVHAPTTTAAASVPPPKAGPIPPPTTSIAAPIHPPTAPVH